MDEVRGKLVIGLAGGIGCGKSTVARILADNGAGVIDSDRLNHKELEQAEVIKTLVRWFGPDVCDPDGNLRRDALAEIVFNDPRQRERVEGLLHPRIARRRRELIEAFEADPKIRAIVLDSPLLYEAGLDRLCDVVVYVEAAKAQRAARVAADRGWSPESWSQREKSQEPLDSKRAKADHIVVNNSGLDDLRSKVERLLTELLAQATGGWDIRRADVEDC